MTWDAGLDPNSSAYQIAASPSARLRVIAGPGTGKSFAMKRRVARLLQQGVGPRQILPVTFTRVAAEDLHRELVGLAVPGADQLQGRTLHSLSLRILNRNQVLQATGRVPRPLNQFELRPLICDLPANFGGIRDKEKLRLAYEAAWARLQHEDPGYAPTAVERGFEASLLAWLKFHRAMLIGEVIPHLYIYLRNNPGAEERAEYAHVLVDEFQDLNKAEQGLVDLLGERAALCIIGDDDQSLYSFKHAHPEGIREWAEGDAQRVDQALLECRRCPTHIVAMANSLIAHNQHRVPRQLVPRPANGQGHVEILQFQTLDQEAVGIADRIEAMIRARLAVPGDILVLAQRKVIGTPIFQALRERQVPTKSYYAETELDSIEAQRQLSLLKLLVDNDDRVALRWLLGYGHATFYAPAYARVRAHCEQHQMTPWDVLAHLSAGGIAIPHTNNLVARFREIEAELTALRDAGPAIPDLLQRLFPPDMAGVELLAELAQRKAPDVTTPRELLEEIVAEVAQPEIPVDVQEVRVMSLHKSKGLSSPVVFIAGCIEGALPVYPDEGLTPEQEAAHYEEQRRLFFVGLTRVKADLAQQKPGTLILSGARRMELRDALGGGIQPARRGQGFAHVHASRFLRELGPTAPAPVAV